MEESNQFASKKLMQQKDTRDPRGRLVQKKWKHQFERKFGESEPVRKPSETAEPGERGDQERGSESGRKNAWHRRMKDFLEPKNAVTSPSEKWS